MAGNTRALIVTHTFIFVCGFVAGKTINQDELDTYRAIHETKWTRLQRTMNKVAFGMLAMGTIIVAIRASRK